MLQAEEASLAMMEMRGQEEHGQQAQSSNVLTVHTEEADTVAAGSVASADSRVTS